jgi:hypothetical protein
MPVPRKQRDPAPRHPLPPVAGTLAPSMLGRLQIGISIVLSVALAAGWNDPPSALPAQDQNFAAHDLLARGRVFPEVGAGVSVIKKDAAGRYYILAAPAKSIAIYQADGKRVGQIPNQNSHGATIAYAQDFDIDATGAILIADRGANSVKIFAPDGTLESSFAFAMPLSIVALPDGSCAMKSLSSGGSYFSIVSRQGKNLRTFRTPPSSPGNGPIFGDASGHIYLAFADTDAPTVRKYDAYGASDYEFSLSAADFETPAERRHGTKITIEQGAAPASTKAEIQTLATDPESEEVWVGIFDELVHIDPEGNRRAAYRTSTQEGTRIEPRAMLIEHNRILIADEELGIFDFPLPERLPSATPRP